MATVKSTLLASAVMFAVLASRGVVAAPRDDAGARQAFRAAYAVFMHPRCMNCHPAGDVPLQGDDSRRHAPSVVRGPDGRGQSALRCANCHQDANLPGENMPPGSPNWHLPPPQMRMVFEGKTPRELARQLKDPEQNGGRTLEQLIHHLADDPLVLWGWDPGEGRTKPPLGHAEFVRNMREWADKGAASPE
jgi:mono/diheme cytochrome c family protein